MTRPHRESRGRMFITLEGGEGTGKTTQAALLAERLRAQGYRVRQTREPGGTPLADAIRALLLHPDQSVRALASANLAPSVPAPDALLPLTEALLLSAGRAQHVALIRQWLAGGEIVLCDRYADATRAYQGAGRGYDTDVLIELERLATGGLRPDLTLLLDLPVEEGLRRRAHAHALGGELNRLDRETAAFHERVRAGYRALAAAEPERWVVVDASLPPDEVAGRIWQAVAARVAQRGI